MSTFKTRGIVLRSIKYGETSLVVNIFTELFGIQTYMVNGVRTNKKTAAKANHFQTGAVLDLLVYHQEARPMQRIKEFSWSFLYEELLTDVIKNSIAAFMLEILHKCLKQPEPNKALFYFCESALLHLDKASRRSAANYPLFFAAHLAHFFGFRIIDNYDSNSNILDLKEGLFIDHQPVHPYFVAGQSAATMAEILKVMQPHELEELNLNQPIRRKLLLHYQDYYGLHIADFGQLKTLMVLQEVL